MFTHLVSLYDRCVRAARPRPNSSSTSLTLCGGINWKAGFTIETDGSHRALTAEELARLRKERNRLHAKMTRDRKKVTAAPLPSIKQRIREGMGAKPLSSLVPANRFARCSHAWNWFVT